MTQIGIPPRDTSAWDVPATQVADEFIALKQARLVAGLTAEARHLLDPADGAYALMACGHPEACSTEADYPGWIPGGVA